MFAGQCAEFCGLHHSRHDLHRRRRQPPRVQRVGPRRAAEAGPTPGERRPAPRRSRLLGMPGWLGALVSTDHKRIGLNARPVLAVLLPARRRVGAADAHAAGAAATHFVSDEHLQRAVHDARLDDDLPVRDADGDGDGACTWCRCRSGPRGSACAAAGARGLLDVAVRRPVMQSGWLTVRRRRSRRLVRRTCRCRTASNTPGVGQDLWALGVILAAAGMTLDGGVRARHDRAPPRPGDVAAADAGVHMDRARQRADGRGGLPGAGAWRWCCSTSNATARTSTRVRRSVIDYQDLFWFFGHPVVYVMFFPYLGGAAEAIAVNAAQALVRLQAFVLSMHGLRRPVDERVVTPHVHVTGGVTNQYFAFTSTLLVVPAGIEYFDMIGTLIGGSIVLRTSMLFALGVLHPVPDRRPQRHLRRLAGPRLPGARHLHRRRALPLHAVRRQRLRLLRRRLPLVPEDHRRLPARAPRQAAPRAAGDRHEHDVLPDVRPRRRGHAPAHRAISPAPGLGDAEPDREHRRGDHRAGRARLPDQRVVSLREREPAGDDPWLGHTLEWATSRRRRGYNFDRPLPPITSYAPLLDLREPRPPSRERADAGSMRQRCSMRGGADRAILLSGAALLALCDRNAVWRRHASERDRCAAPRERRGRSRLQSLGVARCGAARRERDDAPPDAGARPQLRRGARRGRWSALDLRPGVRALLHLLRSGPRGDRRWPESASSCCAQAAHARAYRTRPQPRGARRARCREPVARERPVAALAAAARWEPAWRCSTPRPPRTSGCTCGGLGARRRRRPLAARRGPRAFLAGIAASCSSRCSRASTPTTTGCCRPTWSSTCCCCWSRRRCCWGTAVASRAPGAATPPPELARRAPRDRRTRLTRPPFCLAVFGAVIVAHASAAFYDATAAPPARPLRRARASTSSPGCCCGGR